MSSSNPYSPSAVTTINSAPVRIRVQQPFRQALLFSIFYFVGFGFLVAFVAGLTAVPRMFAGVYEDFAGIWLLELIYALAPYVAIRSLTIGRFVRPSWWSFCLAGVVTFPFLHIYGNAMIRQWDTPFVYHVGAHLLSVVSALMVELMALVCFGRLFRHRRDAEQTDEREPE